MARMDVSAGGIGPSRRPKVVVLALLAIIVVALISNWLQGGKGSGMGVLHVAVLSGSATVVHPDGSSIEARPGDIPTIASGDELVTGEEALVRLGLGSSGFIQVGAFSRVILLQLESPALTRGSLVSLGLLKGTARISLEDSLLRAPQAIVETNVLTATGRGAEFLCEALAADHTRVTIQRGEVTISKGEQSVSLVPGQYVDAWLGQPLEPLGTPLPEVPTEGTSPTPDTGWGYWDESNKTLFPPIVTPSLPGDVPAEATPIPNGGGGEQEIYVVQEGDTLYSIARRYGLSWEDLWAANKDSLAAPELLQVGQSLRIPRQTAP